MLFFESCRYAMERKENCADDGIYQVNSIGPHKNSSKPHEAPPEAPGLVDEVNLHL